MWAALAAVAALVLLCCSPVLAARASLEALRPSRPLEPLVPEVIRHVVGLLPPFIVHTPGTKRARIWPSTGADSWPVSPEAIIETSFLPGGELIVVLDRWGTSTVWSVRSRLQVATFQLRGAVGEPQAFPDGERVVTHSNELSQAVIWNVTTGEVLQRIFFKGARDDVVEVRILPGDRMVTAVSNWVRTEVVIWDAITGKQLHALRHHGRLRSLEVSPCGGKLATTGSYDIFLWDSTTGALELRLKVQPGRRPLQVEVSRGGALVCANVGENISIWDAATGELSATLSMPDDVIDFAILDDDRRLVALAEQSGAVWDVVTGELLMNFTFAARQARVSATSDSIAICSTTERLVNYEYVLDFSAKVWDVSSGRLVHRYTDLGGDGRLRPGPCSISVSSVAAQLMDSWADS